MIVNEEERWIYLGPPKTGSTTMHKELVQSPWNGRRVETVDQHEMNEEFARLPFVGDRRSDFGNHNAPVVHSPWAKYKNPRLINLINEWAAKDLEQFNYPYETCDNDNVVVQP